MSTLTHSPHAAKVGRKSRTAPSAAMWAEHVPEGSLRIRRKALSHFRPTTIHVKEALAA